MAYNYFGMTTKAWEAAHCASDLALVPPGQVQHPLVFVALEKPSRTEEDGHYYMIAKAETAHGKQVLPPMYLARDKQTLTADKAEACHVGMGWKYDRETDWRAAGCRAIKLMAKLVLEAGIPKDCVKEWYE